MSRPGVETETETLKNVFRDVSISRDMFRDIHLYLIFNIGNSETAEIIFMTSYDFTPGLRKSFLGGGLNLKKAPFLSL